MSLMKYIAIPDHLWYDMWFSSQHLSGIINHKPVNMCTLFQVNGYEDIHCYHIDCKSLQWIILIFGDSFCINESELSHVFFLIITTAFLLVYFVNRIWFQFSKCPSEDYFCKLSHSRVSLIWSYNMVKIIHHLSNATLLVISRHVCN